jgi:hypothetical protein
LYNIRKRPDWKNKKEKGVETKGVETIRIIPKTLAKFISLTLNKATPKTTIETLTTIIGRKKIVNPAVGKNPIAGKKINKIPKTKVVAKTTHAMTIKNLLLRYFPK